MVDQTTELLKGAPIAKRIKADVAHAVEQASVTPVLVNVVVGNDEASANYLGAIHKLAAKLGIESRRLNLPADVTQEALEQAVWTAGDDSSVSGLMIQFPLPKGLDRDRVATLVPPDKDVDGITPASLGALVAGQRRHTAPCTAAAVIEMLTSDPACNPDGKHVVVIGRSLVVGRPVALMLSGRGEGANATVTVCHTGTPNVTEYSKAADILIVAAGVRSLIKPDMVRPGAVVVDVGTHVVETEDGKTTLVGDVDPGVTEVAGRFTPVPGGVGPVTNAVLMRHVAARALPDAFGPAW